MLYLPMYGISWRNSCKKVIGGDVMQLNTHTVYFCTDTWTKNPLGTCLKI